MGKALLVSADCELNPFEVEVYERVRSEILGRGVEARVHTSSQVLHLSAQIVDLRLIQDRGVPLWLLGLRFPDHPTARLRDVLYWSPESLLRVFGLSLEARLHRISASVRSRTILDLYETRCVPCFHCDQLSCDSVCCSQCSGSLRLEIEESLGSLR